MRFMYVFFLDESRKMRNNNYNDLKSHFVKRKNVHLNQPFLLNNKLNIIKYILKRKILFKKIN